MKKDKNLIQYIRNILFGLFILLWLSSSHAYLCLIDSQNYPTGLSRSEGVTSMACGSFTMATGHSSTAFGVSAQATRSLSLAAGYNTLGFADRSTAIGAFAATPSFGATALGFAAGTSNPDVFNSPHAITIGYRSLVSPLSPGAIAIGGDVNDDFFGARATAAGAIAIGADVINDVAHSMLIKVPLRMERDIDAPNGPVPHHQLKITDKYVGKDVRTLLNLQCETCTPGFRLNRVNPTNDTWFFRMIQNGNFSIDDPATIPKEAEFRSGGDLKIGGKLIQASSRDIKNNIVNVDTSDILEKLGELPIHKWTYDHNPKDVRHMGPMAEDFYQAFGLGDTDKGISTLDVSGVALAAIQALKQENEKLSEEIEALKAHLGL